MNAIDINALTFKYKNTYIFNNLNLSIRKGSFTTIIGNNGSGKTTLIKLLLGFEKSQGINIFNKPLNGNIRNIRKQIGVIFENPSIFFVFDTVREEIEFSMSNLNLSKEKQENKFLEITKELQLEQLLELNPVHLSLEDQYLVALASCLASDFQIIIIDNALDKIKEKVKKILKKANKKGITIINFTTNPEEILLGNFTIFIDNSEAIFAGTNRKLLNNLEIFDKTKIELPFIIDLSNKLIFYNLIDKKYTNMEKLVDDIWK